MTQVATPEICFSDGGAKFLCDRFGTPDPVFAARQAVAELFASHESRLPIRLDRLLAARNIELCTGSVPLDKEAVLIPTNGGYRLTISEKYRRPLAERRPRFTIAHELLESYFFCNQSSLPIHWSHLPGYRSMTPPPSLRAGGAEERLCDYGAGLILIPSSEVGRLTDNGRCTPSYSDLRRSAHACNASVLNITHRIANYLGIMYRRHVMIVLVKKCTNPNKTDQQIKWRLWPTKRNAGFPVGVDISAQLKHRAYIATNKSLEKIGLGVVAEWLENGADNKSAPIGQVTSRVLASADAKTRVNAITFDKQHAVATIWLDLDFTS